MKKKLFLMMMVCMMGTSVFVSGCGKTDNEAVEEDDEDEDDDDRDDDIDDDKDDDKDDDEDDGKDDDKPAQVQIVKEIDSETLADQLKVFIDSRDKWAANGRNDATVESIGYCITDFDHNGRAELNVSREFDYSGYYEVLTFEISEDGSDFTEVSWNYVSSGITGNLTPSLMSPPTLKCYYDRENGEVHYLTSAYFDNGNGNYGSVNEDMKLVNGSVTCGIYSAISVQETVDQDTYEYSYEYEYYGAGDSKISESDFYDMFVTYPEGFSTRDVNLGFLRRYYSQDMYLKDLDDVALKNALYDSYCVFNGTVDPYEYDDMYNLPEAGYIEPDLYSASIGKWTLYSSEVEGDVNYYDWDSPRMITMDIYDDYSVYIHNYEYGTVDSNYSSHLEEINTYPIFWVDMMKEIGKADEYGVEEYSYEIVAVYTEEGNAFMEIAFDGWDKWGDWVVGSHLTFIREDY